LFLNICTIYENLAHCGAGAWGMGGGDTEVSFIKKSDNIVVSSENVIYGYFSSKIEIFQVCNTV
jgi:hypothetical protein